MRVTRQGTAPGPCLEDQLSPEAERAYSSTSRVLARDPRARPSAIVDARRKTGGCRNSSYVSRSARSVGRSASRALRRRSSKRCDELAHAAAPAQPSLLEPNSPRSHRAERTPTEHFPPNPIPAGSAPPAAITELDATRATFSSVHVTGGETN